MVLDALVEGTLGTDVLAAARGRSGGAFLGRRQGPDAGRREGGIGLKV